MSSRLGWLDHDDAERARMLEVVKLFQDEGSVDELGIGPIRDAFSNSFFPGTSVLHTRARYLLFIPWLIQDVTKRGRSIEEAQRELRAREVRLIRALLAGGEKTGVIGSQAQDRLKTMPSQVYWPALGRLGIRLWDTSVDGYLRSASQRARRRTEVSDSDAAHQESDHGFAALPPAPDDLLKSTTFDLTADEAQAVSDHFARLPSSSLLSWFGSHATSASGDYVWENPQLPHMPDEHRRSIDHARRLHHVWNGAPLLYNLMVAQLSDDDIRSDDYAERLESWAADIDDAKVVDGWSRTEFWSLVRGLNPRIGRATMDFLDRWVELVEAGEYSSDAAERLIWRRELSLKGRRSRLQYADARAGWSGYAGLVSLDYRWGVAQRFLTDVLDAAPGREEATV